MCISERWNHSSWPSYCIAGTGRTYIDHQQWKQHWRWTTKTVITTASSREDGKQYRKSQATPATAMQCNFMRLYWLLLPLLPRPLRSTIIYERIKTFVPQTLMQLTIIVKWWQPVCESELKSAGLDNPFGLARSLPRLLTQCTHHTHMHIASISLNWHGPIYPLLVILYSFFHTHSHAVLQLSYVLIMPSVAMTTTTITATAASGRIVAESRW